MQNAALSDKKILSVNLRFVNKTKLPACIIERAGRNSIEYVDNLYFFRYITSFTNLTVRSMLGNAAATRFGA